MKAYVLILMSICVVLCVAFVGSTAMAEEITISGAVKAIDPGANSAVIATFEGPEVVIGVEDELTLKKFRERIIRVGDEVKVKYIIINGRNVATYFRKIIGC